MKRDTNYKLSDGLFSFISDPFSRHDTLQHIQYILKFIISSKLLNVNIIDNIIFTSKKKKMASVKYCTFKVAIFLLLNVCLNVITFIVINYLCHKNHVPSYTLTVSIYFQYYLFTFKNNWKTIIIWFHILILNDKNEYPYVAFHKM